MRYKIFAFVMGLMLVNFVLAEGESVVVDPTDAAALDAAKGKTVSITGTVSKAEWSKSGKVMNIELEKADHFVGAAFVANKEGLDKSFSGDFAKALTGAKVKFTGKLETYGGKAKDYENRQQLVIKAASQVTILEAPTTAPSAPAKTE